MNVFYPSYYEKFKCIADRCRHSCCVGWEIRVDDDTMARYSSMDGEILSHISPDEPVIELCDNGRCPFLLDSGLCRIISHFGEDHISQICREHPRFYHRVGERVEGGIGMVCEEAARIILSNDNYSEFLAVEKSDADPADESDFDALSHREKIYSILSRRDIPLDERIEMIRAEYSIPERIHGDDEWNEILSDLEYLDDDHRAVISLGEADCREEMSRYLERFFAYLVFRHLSIAKNPDNLRARLGFCLLLLRMMENSVSKTEIDLDKIADTARIISEEIEYSDENTDSLIFEFESEMI